MLISQPSATGKTLNDVIPTTFGSEESAFAFNCRFVTAKAIRNDKLLGLFFLMADS